MDSPPGEKPTKKAKAPKTAIARYGPHRGAGRERRPKPGAAREAEASTEGLGWCMERQGVRTGKLRKDKVNLENTEIGLAPWSGSCRYRAP